MDSEELIGIIRIAMNSSEFSTDTIGKQYGNTPASVGEKWWRQCLEIAVLIVELDLETVPDLQSQARNNWLGGKGLNIRFSSCVGEPLNQSVQPGSFVSKRTRISSSRSPRSLLNGGCCTWQSLGVRRNPLYFQAIPLLGIPINSLAFFINCSNSLQFVLIRRDSQEY